VKHLRSLSSGQPAQANIWQDIICQFAGVLSALLGAFGGASPLTDYVDDKCLIPTPNPDTTDT
jgi:hypothetical protein